MSDTSSLLFGLDDHVVLDVQHVGSQSVRVVIEPTAEESACPRVRGAVRTGQGGERDKPWEADAGDGSACDAGHDTDRYDDAAGPVGQIGVRGRQACSRA